MRLVLFILLGWPAAAQPFLQHRVGQDLSEGVSVFDFDKDGSLDVLSGSFWYKAPHWKAQKFRDLGFVNEYVVNCGEFAVDVNGDGFEDILGAGWQEDGIFYWENPRKLGALWPKRKIVASKDTEGLAMADVDGDGHKDLLVSNYSRQPMLWIRVVPKKDFEVHVIQADGKGNGHGIGFGDIDGDGKGDIVTERGWFRQIDWKNDQWEYKAEFYLHDASIRMEVSDVDLDGKADIIFGKGHDYGLFWLKQVGGGKWTQHAIDESFSQVHTVALEDIDGDGKLELLAGKRYRAHNEKDPGAYEPVVFYYYRYRPGSAPSFERIPLAVNSPASPGMQLVVVDLDGDGDKDIVTAGKGGQFWFENLKINKVPNSARPTFYQLW